MLADALSYWLRLESATVDQVLAVLAGWIGLNDAQQAEVHARTGTYRQELAAQETLTVLRPASTLAELAWKHPHNNGPDMVAVRMTVSVAGERGCWTGISVSATSQSGRPLKISTPRVICEIVESFRCVDAKTALGKHANLDDCEQRDRWQALLSAPDRRLACVELASERGVEKLEQVLTGQAHVARSAQLPDGVGAVLTAPGARGRSWTLPSKALDVPASARRTRVAHWAMLNCPPSIPAEVQQIRQASLAPAGRR
jgi:hypothetical protein